MKNLLYKFGRILSEGKGRQLLYLSARHQTIVRHVHGMIVAYRETQKSLFFIPSIAKPSIKAIVTNRVRTAMAM